MSIFRKTVYPNIEAEYTPNGAIHLTANDNGRTIRYVNDTPWRVTMENVLGHTRDFYGTGSSLIIEDKEKKVVVKNVDSFQIGIYTLSSSDFEYIKDFGFGVYDSNMVLDNIALRGIVRAYRKIYHEEIGKLEVPKHIRLARQKTLEDITMSM